MELIFSQYARSKAHNKCHDSEDIIFEEEPAIAIEKKNKNVFTTYTNDLNVRYCHEREINEKRTKLLKLKAQFAL